MYGRMGNWPTLKGHSQHETVFDGVSLFLDIQEFVSGVKLIRILHIYRRVENNDTGYRKAKITARENFQGVRDQVTSIVPCDHSQVMAVVFCKPMWPMRPMRILDEYIV